ncbi:O-methyltransferase [Aspergillus sclerotioniger CBS 115572]|uniref:catechol O-methyltransferase n=1 Tax=Aspergillus sclerotioniger CBS 115572 TaxID=1450535 RepID=A0A317WSW7_9EURO|nr:O-methyltransferase [Aspergillus sclerotioniger CBS 115572]PWY89456.1 O-methyltransferase [Aspergillus sclerotioniger CBS 115572]
MSFYKPEEKIFHNDGREQALLEYIQSHPSYDEMHGNPERILAAIDEFGREKDFLMNVGQSKGAIVVKMITDRNPRIMVELGGYVGYSAILFGNALRKAGGQKFISLEVSPVFADISDTLIRLAGLEDIVEIIVGPCRESLRALREVYPNRRLDMIFFDHRKVQYVNDLKLCEELRLVAPGTTVLADNVISPGNPAYLEYVRFSTKKKAEHARLQSSEGDQLEDLSTGDPFLVYDTLTVRGLEVTGVPDAVEVSYCLGFDFP